MAAEAGDTKVPRIPIEAHAIKKGKHVMLKGKPCKIADVATSKTGKHGHMKCNITGIDVLTGKKYNEVVPGHAAMVEFKLEKTEYQLIEAKADGSLTLMDARNATDDHPVDADTELFKKLKEDFDGGKQLNVTLIKAPVETAKDKFVDMEVLEAYKEDKAGENK